MACSRALQWLIRCTTAVLLCLPAATSLSNVDVQSSFETLGKKATQAHEASDKHGTIWLKVPWVQVPSKRLDSALLQPAKQKSSPVTAESKLFRLYLRLCIHVSGLLQGMFKSCSSILFGNPTQKQFGLLHDCAQA